MISLPSTKTQLIKDIQKILKEKGYISVEVPETGMMDTDTITGIDLYLATKKQTVFDVIIERVWNLLKEDIAEENKKEK